MLSFFWKFWKKPGYVITPVAAMAFIFGIIDGIKVAGFSDLLPDAVQHLPLNEQNLAWLIPSLIVLVISIIVDRVKHSNS